MRGVTVKRLFLTLLILMAGAVLFQGFQCSSPEMTTARVALNNGDTLKAKAKLQELVRKSPNNGEAWFFLSQIEVNIQNYKEASFALGNARKNMGAKVTPEQIAGVEAAIWGGSYVKGFNFLRDYPEKKDDRLLDSAVYYISIAKEVRPDNPEIHRMLAIAYENKKDEDKAIESYNKFVEIMKPSIDYAVEKGMFIGQDAMMTMMKAGKLFIAADLPITEKDEDSLAFFGVKDDKNEVYFFVSDTKRNGKYTLKGWAVNQPNYLTMQEKTSWRAIITNPYLALAEIFFNRKEYDKSLSYIMTVSSIEPFNIAVNDYIVQIYQAQGKRDEALNVIKAIVDKNPNNSYYIQRYADILATFEKWEEAAANYEKAIAADNTSKDVPRAYQNLGVCYKNIAASIYTRQKELEEKKIKVDKMEYEPYLFKSVDSYRKALNYDEQKENLDILHDLFDIHYLQGVETDLKDIILRIEGMETGIKTKGKEIQQKYYQLLIKIYDRNYNEFTDKAFFKDFPQKMERVTKEIGNL